MSDLTDFLLARIAEDERDVAAALRMAEPWCWGDPDRVRAECEAKRRIVTTHGPYEMGGEDYCGTCGDVPQVDYPCQTLRLLALPYADDRDYRQEWKP